MTGLLLDVAGGVLLGVGVLLTVVAGIGLVRLPDVLTRMHAQAKPAVLGTLLVLAGVALVERSASLTAVVVVVAVLQLLTSPVGSTMLGHAAHLRRQHEGGITRRDDLAQGGPGDRGL